MKSINLFDVDDVLRFYEMAIKLFGGSYGLRDKGLLESAIAQPKLMSQYNDYDIFDLAASYFFHIIKNHPFVDGNKRTTLITTISFLEINGFEKDYEFDSLYQYLLRIQV